MFLMSWKEFDKYCQWLFSVLVIAEKEINITNYNSVQKTYFLDIWQKDFFNIYIYANQLKVKGLPILKISDEINNTNLIKRIARTQVNNLTALFHKI